MGILPGKMLRSAVLLGCLALAAALAAVGQRTLSAQAPAGTSEVVSAKTASPAPTAVAAVLPRAAGPRATRATSLPDRALLDKYCVTCHSDRAKTGGLSLQAANPSSAEGLAAHQDVWEKVIRRVRTGSMPPVGYPRPDKATIIAFTGQLESGLDVLASTRPDPGRPTAHRLNRAEYANAIRDFLGLEIDGRRLLPADDVDQDGFDNIASVLSVSPVLMERYLSAARAVSRVAVGDPTLSAEALTYTVPKALSQDVRVNEALPFGSRGGVLVRHMFPLDGEYEIKVRLQRQLYDYVKGMAHPHQLEVRVDGKRVGLFEVGGQYKGRQAPETHAGNSPGPEEWEAYTQHADEHLRLRLPVKAGVRDVGVSFVKHTWLPEGIAQPPLPIRSVATDENWWGEAGVDRLDVAGPFKGVSPQDTPSRRKIFSCYPTAASEQIACAKTIVASLARGAYRRPVGEADTQVLMQFYERGAKTAGFERGIQSAIERLLMDPEFLFRVPRDPATTTAGGVYRISDVELASRLSFFIWSSVPDQALIDVALSGKLREPKMLDAQVKRMLADPRSAALVENFGMQWLSLRSVNGVTPDPLVFESFDENLRRAFIEETRLFFGSQIADDRSVLDLLRADYTFVNERLARHYGIGGVVGSRFRRVPVADVSRRGLFGQGSILLSTAYPTRTSPVLRGKWILDNILGMPPAAPPPNVPSLDDTGAVHLSVRARMEEHRKNPMCARCHATMDPLGFALEHFDGIGAWRTVEAEGGAIDSSGVLPDGTKFSGVADLTAALTTDPYWRGLIVETLAEKLLSYAMGRTAESHDMPAVRQIVRDAGGVEYRWSSIIMGVVNSVPFQMRRMPS